MNTHTYSWNDFVAYIDNLNQFYIYQQKENPIVVKFNVELIDKKGDTWSLGMHSAISGDEK